MTCFRALWLEYLQGLTQKRLTGVARHLPPTPSPPSPTPILLVKFGADFGKDLVARIIILYVF